VQEKCLKILLYIVITVALISCQAVETATFTPAVSPTQLPTSTKIIATPTKPLPIPTQTAIKPPSEVPVPALFERSEQELGMRETVQAALGDLDGDGDLDTVFANPMRSKSEVWLNDGSGWLENTGQELTQYGHGVELADLDEDGDLDAFIVCHQFTTGSKIYLNDGNGVLTENGQSLGDAELSGVEIHLIDVNKDGHVDAHVAYYNPAGAPDQVYLNDGTAQFRDSGLSLEEDTIAWGDLDRDGDMDYFGKRVGKGYVVQLNNGSGDFLEGWQIKDEQATIGAVALADFDQDGDLDALVTNGHRTTGTFPSRLFWNNGDGTFTDSQQQLNDTSGAELAVGDLDLDGDLDVIVANMDRPNEVWLNNNGHLYDSGLRLGEPSELSGRATLGDLDGDGDLDLVMGRFQGGGEIWFNTTLTPANAEGLVTFYSERDGDAEIYLMNPDGSHPHALTDNTTDDFSPAFSPDGAMIVFESDRDDPHPRSCFPDCNYNLYVMNSDGSEQRQLTAMPGAEWHADWSADGKSLIFTGGEIGFKRAGIYKVGLDGREPEPVLVDDFNNDAADWSPDGTQIAFSSDREGNTDIYVMNADGSDIHKVIDTGMDDYFPDWSPDGEKIVFFAADWPSIRQDIFTVNADGSNLLNLNNTPQIVDEDPKWSPDGSKIIFQSDRDGNFEIYRMNPDGSQPQNLTQDAGRDYMPDWWMPETLAKSMTSTSRKIAFVSTRDGNGEIYVMDSDGGNPVRLTNHPTWDGFPGWSPDGRQMLLSSDRDGDQEIYIVNRDGSNLIRLTDNEYADYMPSWSPDGECIAYVSDRDGNDEIYLMKTDGIRSG
jgi:Tol biopolymer transport system component